MEKFFNKEQAAQYLKVSARSLQRYMKERKIRFHYRRAKNGRQIAIFTNTDLRTFRRERGQWLVVREKKQPATQSEQSRQITLTKRIADSLYMIVLANKLALTREEAAKLSGYPFEQIKNAIRQGKLKASSTGGGWRVKRTDLDDYVRQL